MQVMKVILLLTLGLTGCVAEVDSRHLYLAEEICKEHKGVAAINTFFTPSAICVDGTHEVLKKQ